MLKRMVQWRQEAHVGRDPLLEVFPEYVEAEPLPRNVCAHTHSLATSG